jgi:hypothetical protein
LLLPFRKNILASLNETTHTGGAMDCNMILLLLALACNLFVLFVFVVVRIALPPVKPIEVSKDDREHIQRAYRNKKTA